MSRSGWSTANFLSSAVAAAAPPITIACWIKPTAIASQSWIAAVSKLISASGDISGLAIGSGGVIQARSVAGGSNANSGAGTAVAGVWQHACAVLSSTVLRYSYLNGIKGANNITSNAPATPDHTSAGMAFVNSAGSAPFNGQIADLAMWSVVLDDFEVWQLAQGVRPGFIRPVFLAGWWEMKELNGAELDRSGTFDHLAVTGTSPPYTSDDPALVPDSQDWLEHAVVSSAAFKAYWAAQRNLVRDGWAT